MLFDPGSPPSWSGLQRPLGWVQTAWKQRPGSPNPTRLQD